MIIAIQNSASLKKPRCTLAHCGTPPAGMTKALTTSGRQILSLLRRHGALSKAEVARHSGLSAQTASTLMRNLENDGFLSREATVRGCVGQPPAPMSINPNAVYSIGISIYAQHIRSVLIDFGGNIVGTHEAIDDFFQPERILRAVGSSICTLESLLDSRQSRRIAGIGLTASSEVWTMAEATGLSLGSITTHPVWLDRHNVCAVKAELVLGAGRRYPTYIHFFIGSVVLGGAVRDSTLSHTRQGNLPSIDLLPIWDENGQKLELGEIVSLTALENLVPDREAQAAASLQAAHDRFAFAGSVDGWIRRSARALAQAINTAHVILDIEAAVIDGEFPDWVCKQLVLETGREFLKAPRAFVPPPDVIAGSHGAFSPAIGAAALPLGQYGL